MNGHFLSRSVNIVYIKRSEAQLEGILYYPNSYPELAPTGECSNANKLDAGRSDSETVESRTHLLNDLLAILLARTCARPREPAIVLSCFSERFQSCILAARSEADSSEQRRHVAAIVGIEHDARETRQVCGVPCFIAWSGLSRRRAAIRGLVKPENPHAEPA